MGSNKSANTSFREEEVEKRHVVITGPPGIGKSSLVVKVYDVLKVRGVRLGGFITEDLNNCFGERAGFRVVSTDGITGILGFLGSKSDARCGVYGVEIDDFERVALPATDPLRFKNSNGVVLLDEIRNMTLFSGWFQKNVEDLFDAPKVKILATIPLPPVVEFRTLPFIENIRNRSDVKLIELDYFNRNSFFNQILDHFLN